MAAIDTVDSLEGLEELLAGSAERPLWLFKHSLTCGISAAAWQEFRAWAEARPAGGATYAVVEIQRARPVSAAVAERTGVRHESPQVLRIEGGEATWSASHWAITRRALDGAA